MNPSILPTSDESRFFLSVIVPVFNEASALEATVLELLPCLPDSTEVILVDDGSTDGSSIIADRLALNDPRVRSVHHFRNEGYGQALKTGADYARGDRLLFFDSDGQHDPSVIPILLDRLEEQNLDMVVGRRLGQARAHPLRAPSKWALGIVANILARSRIPDLNSGQRIIRSDIFRQFRPLLPSGFSLSTTLTISCLKLGVRTDFVETRVRSRTGKSSVRYLRDGYATLLLIVRLIALFDPLTFFMPIAVTALLLALGYGTAVAVWRGQGFPAAAVFVGIGGLLVFLLGIVCDQISALRLEYLKLRPRGTGSREGT